MDHFWISFMPIIWYTGFVLIPALLKAADKAGGQSMNMSIDINTIIGAGIAAVTSIICAFIAARYSTKKAVGEIKESVKKTESWVGDPKSGVLADTGLIVNTTQRIDDRTEKLAQAIPKDLAVLAENTRHSLRAIEKSRVEHRSAEMILADVQRALTERQDGRDKIIELQRQNDLLTERIEKLEKQNQQLQREVERYEERDEEIDR